MRWLGHRCLMNLITFIFKTLLQRKDLAGVFEYELAIHTLPHLKYILGIRLVYVRSSLPCINIGV